MILPNQTEREKVLARILVPPEERAKRNAALIAVLDSFMEGDENEQRETGEFLMKALDEDRPSYRKLFPK